MWGYRLVLIHLANFADALLTLLVVSRGVEEANPLIAPFIESNSYMAFLLVKFSVVAMSVEVLRLRLSKGQDWVLTGLLIVMLSVLCWHAYGVLYVVNQ